jgi:hypothetical protein
LFASLHFFTPLQNLVHFTHIHRKAKVIMFRKVLSLCLLAVATNSFGPQVPSLAPSRQTTSPRFAATGEDIALNRIEDEEEGVPIPFLDMGGNSFIECYADSVAAVDGTDYTIGVPCDYCVALCYFENKNLVPVELNDKLMDDIFPVAENIVGEEFGEELALQRTPQTLTLVGELDDDFDDEDMEDEEDLDDENYDGEEEVEVLLTFEHRKTEFHLVRLLDPVLLVGKTDPERPDLRILLTPEESNNIMPVLEDTFLKFHDDRESS